MGVNTTNLGQSHTQPLQLPSNLTNMTGLTMTTSSGQLSGGNGLNGGGSLGGGGSIGGGGSMGGGGGNINNSHSHSQQELLQMSMSRQSTPVGSGVGLDHLTLYQDHLSGGSPRNTHPHNNPCLSHSQSSTYLDYHLGGVDLSPTRSHGDPPFAIVASILPRPITNLNPNHYPYPIDLSVPYTQSWWR